MPFNAIIEPCVSNLQCCKELLLWHCIESDYAVKFISHSRRLASIGSIQSILQDYFYHRYIYNHDTTQFKLTILTAMAETEQVKPTIEQPKLYCLWH